MKCAVENDNGLPTTDTVVKIHYVLGGDLPVMLELAKCLPDEILDRYIRRPDDGAMGCPGFGRVEKLTSRWCALCR